tara:strand:+ start:146 stop:292 length:147 start_codon:yes stop_codon:yes gene_type:complete
MIFKKIKAIAINEGENFEEKTIVEKDIVNPTAACTNLLLSSGYNSPFL